MIGLLAFAMVATGYAFVARSGCSGMTAVTLVSAPDQSTILSTLAERWQETKPSVNGRCVRLDVSSKDSAQVVDAMSPAWDSKQDGPRPDIWAPESSTWVTLARGRPDTRDLLPPVSPPLARSPIVVAMPRPMAVAIGWPNLQLGWMELLNKVSDDQRGWAASGHPEWGRLRMGVADPGRDTAALAALSALVNYDGDNDLSDTELVGAFKLEHAVSIFVPTTEQLFQGLAKADAAGTALQYVSAFPATERDVIQYNSTNPRVPLDAVYPPEGAPSADHPFVVLHASWVDSLRRAAAAQLLAFINSPKSVQAYVDEGFRPPDGRATAMITEAHGFLTAGGTDRPPEDAGILLKVIATWTAMRRAGNALTVVDTSRSMAKRVPGTDKTRLEIAQQAAVGVLQLLKPDSNLALWSFASQRHELVPLGPVAKQRGPFEKQLGGLKPGGGSALYETTLAAYERTLADWQPNRLNVIILLCDGRDEERNGLSRTQLVAELTRIRDPKKPIQLAAIAYGPDADVGALRAITAAVDGRTYLSDNPTDLPSVLLSAIVGVNAASG
ncbi:MAG: substrate-binding domain-containing protein [Mycobacteriales bacterium]